MAISALLKFSETVDVKSKNSNENNESAAVSITPQVLSALFQADDKLLSTDHMTEFWY
jgi:hypothetical protein